MLGALVVLWLGSEPELTERRADIAAWASTHQLRSEPLRPTAPSYDLALADRIEALLEEARVATSAPGTPGALERAEALLLEHPELPQAAWLLAERFAIEAHALTAPDATARDRRVELGALARALEGARAQPAGALPVPGAESAAGAPALAPTGARPHDRIFVDGVALRRSSADGSTSEATAAALTPGRHHLRVTRAELPVWAGWVTLESGRAWSLADPTVACSALDLADLSAAADAPEPAPGVRCERWAVARPGSMGSADIAECSGSRCGPWRPTRAAEPLDSIAVAASAAGAEPGAWPSWATWGLVGAGALAATGIVLWQAGAFEREEPGTEFVFTGPSAPALRF